MQKASGHHLHPADGERPDEAGGLLPALRAGAAHQTGRRPDEAVRDVRTGHGQHGRPDGEHDGRDGRGGQPLCRSDEYAGRRRRQRRGRGRLYPRGQRHLPAEHHRAGGRPERPAERPQQERKGRQKAAPPQVSGHLLRKPDRQGPGRPAGRHHRAGPRDLPDHPDPVPAAEEQPLPDRRGRRRQDRHRRGHRRADRPRAGAGPAQGQGDLPAGPDRSGGGHPVPRPVRAAGQGPAERGEAGGQRDPVHRRDPHHHRRRPCSSTRSTPSPPPARARAP